MPVALGVYLALLAGNCNEKRRAAERAERITVALRAEARENYGQLAASLHYHELFRDTLETYLRRVRGGATELAEVGRLFGSVYRGVRIGTLRSGAYEAALASGAVDALAPELLLTVTDAYTQQREYARLGDNYLAWASRINSQATFSDAVTFMRAMVYDALFRERALRDRLAEAIAALGGEVPTEGNLELGDPYAPGGWGG